MKTTIAPLFVLALAGLSYAETPESTPTLTTTTALTAWLPNNTCGLGPFMHPMVGVNTPLCQVNNGGTMKYASLNFPPNVKTCVVAMLMQPNEIDIADINSTRPLTLRFTYTREGGGTGNSAGGVCSGQCAAMTARVFSQTDGAGFINDPAFGPSFPSDNLPNAGVNFPGKKITGAIRGINFTVAKRNPLMVELCRDPASPQDTSTGTLKLVNPLTVVWPTVGGVSESAATVEAESAAPIE